MSASRRIGTVLVTASLLLLGGCGLAHTPVLAPHGPVASTERDLLFTVAGLMLIVVVPVFVLTAWFAWHYRASNTQARYMPDWSYSAPIDAIVWLVPALLVGSIGYLVWDYTHRLDPYKPIPAAAAPLEVEAVAMNWKWLFIYPEQNIATVNELVFPSDRPLRLDLTSATVMNSFYIPGLGGQVFAMAGMRTRLNLKADGPADLIGRNTQYSGAGFPEQSFAVHATDRSRFDAWVARANGSPDHLDSAALAALERPSGNVPARHYSGVEPDLFARIIAEYAGSMAVPARPSPALPQPSSKGR